VGRAAGFEWRCGLHGRQSKVQGLYASRVSRTIQDRESREEYTPVPFPRSRASEFLLSKSPVVEKETSIVPDHDMDDLELETILLRPAASLPWSLLV
jgi:hypothetical protein